MAAHPHAHHGRGGHRGYRRTNPFAEFLHRATKSFSSKLGVVLLTLIVLACLVGPLLSPYGINDIDLMSMYAGPSAAHPLGCDSMGRDMMTRLMYGGRYSLALGICASLFGAAVGVVIGSVGGYFGGAVETIIMRFMDVWSALPGTMLCILVSNAMGSGFFATVIALTVGGVPGIAIALTVFAINLMGDGVRDALDPKLRD